MRVRRASAADVDALVAFPDGDAIVGLPREQVREDFDSGRMRPGWSWVLEDAGQIVGRALWFGRAEGNAPFVLDALDLLASVDDPVSHAVELLRAGHSDFAASGEPVLPPYTVRLRRGWRDDVQASRAAAWRCEAMAQVGVTNSLERLQYAWTPERAVPDASARLAFRQGSDEEFVELFGQVTRGSLDVETQRALETMDEDTQARDDLEFYKSCPGERDWWRIATETDGGDVAGFIVPSATPYNRNVGYLGVLPQHRGEGFVDDLLGEVTRIHTQAGADRITATTDMTNEPMAAAFDRAGYQVTEIRLLLEAPR